MSNLKSSILSDPKVITFGCRLNAYESEVMRNHARENGLTNTIIFNTCAVTNEAERQGRQAIRRLKRQHPSAQIIVTGCSAQINPNFYKAMPQVDRVLGNSEKMLKDSFTPDLNDKIHVTDIMSIKETSYHLISGFENKARAFIQIQNGCNHRCTFCRIPYGRGNNRSVPMGAIVEQMKVLVSNGCKEIVFTGVDITDYGKDLPGSPSLGQMIKRVLIQVPELPRLRLSSIDPAELDKDVFDLIEDEPRLMPHFHISLQSGDDMILKRMKRRHLRHHILEFCEKVRSLRPESVFGADIIAGFPTETNEMFGNTFNIIDECRLTYLHIFPYSAVEGTPAARMPQVESNEIKSRARLLREKGKQVLKAFLHSQVGSYQQVLVENRNRGHTPTYAEVLLDSAEKLTFGNFVSVKITTATEKHLKGEVLST